MAETRITRLWRVRRRGSEGSLGTVLPAAAFVWAVRTGWLLLVVAGTRPCLSAQQKSNQDRTSASFTANPVEPPTQAREKDPPEELAPLEDLVEQGRYQQAIPALQRYVHDHDSSAKGHYDLGYAFFRTHEIGGAVRELSRSLQLDGKNPQAHKILGLVCTFVGRYDLAEVELQAAAVLEPDSAEIHYFLGRIYYTRQVFPMALKEFQAAIRLNPAYMKAYDNLGLVMEVLGKDDEAVQDFTTAERLNEEQHSNSPWPLEYLSAHYNRQRQPEPAIEFARKALLVDSQCDLAYYNLAQAFDMQKDWPKARDAVQKAIAINSSTPEYFYLLSGVLRRLGKITESEAALKRFEQIHDDQNATAKEWRDANHSPNLSESPSVPDDDH
jgi:tetratricopeptide (TPR) repeat protein